VLTFVPDINPRVTSEDRDLAQPQRKMSETWSDPASQPESPAKRAAYVQATETAPPAQPDTIWPSRTAFRVATLLFSGLLVAALADLVSMWIGVGAIAGLAVTGLTYVAAWSLEIESPWL